MEKLRFTQKQKAQIGDEFTEAFAEAYKAAQTHRDASVRAEQVAAIAQHAFDEDEQVALLQKAGAAAGIEEERMARYLRQAQAFLGLEQKQLVDAEDEALVEATEGTVAL